MKCHYHARIKAVAVCSVCGVPLCKRCVIEDRGEVYCDGCYANEELGDEHDDLAHAEHALNSDDYAELELIDLVDSDDDDGLL